MSSRSRRKARDMKYAMGVDLAADGSDLTAVVTSHKDGVFTVEQVIRADRERMDFEAILGVLQEQIDRDITEITERILRGGHVHFYPPESDPRIIEGEFVPVETREDRLLDAGGSEP